MASFCGGELSAGLPTVPSAVLLNKPPGVLRGGAKGLPNKLVRGVCVGVSCSPESSLPGADCGGVNAVPRLGTGDPPGLPTRERVFPNVGAPPGRGVFVGSGVAFVDVVPRENGCIFDKSGFFFCDSDVFH